MRLLRRTVLLILATILVVGPVVHSHPLHPGGDASELTSHSLCAICAVGAGSAILATAVAIAPTIVIEGVVLVPSNPVTLDVRVALASRAPPAA